MLSIGRSGISYQYSLHGYLYKLPKRTYMGVAAPTYIGHDAKQYRSHIATYIGQLTDLYRSEWQPI